MSKAGRHSINIKLGPCNGKMRWHRRRDAIKQLHRLQSNGIPVKRVYRCPGCNMFHLTSQPQKGTR